MPHILVAGKIHDAGLALLRDAKGFTCEVVQSVAAGAYVPHVPEADALLLRTQPLTADIIAAALRLKIVSRHGVGYDAVDVAALSARNIPLAIVGDVISRAVAEHTLMLMLAAARRTVALDGAARSGNWDERNRFSTGELDGKRLLVVGFGRIGRRVAELAQAFGMAVAALDPRVAAEVMVAAGVEPATSLASELPKADIVSLHVPLAPGGPLLAAPQFALMKPTAIIVNAARGGLVDEMALDGALRGNRLAAAALDVLALEPPAPGHPLLSNPRVTLSPHNAGLTQECAARMAVSAAENIIRHFSGTLDPSRVVNAAALARP